MFVTDWPCMFAVGLLAAGIALYTQKWRRCFLGGLIFSLLCIPLVVYLYEIAPGFVLTALGISPDEVSTALFVLFYSLYPLLYLFGFTVGFYPLRPALLKAVSRLRKSS